ncbi:hypothetical protein [Hymenobacter coalescens]
MLSAAEASLPLRCSRQHDVLVFQKLSLMRHADLPERWKTKIREYLIAKGETKYHTLGASDFPSDSVVRIRFEDDSAVDFKHAFILKAPEWHELAVFTEHCGYHLFQLHDDLDLVIQRSSRDASASSA